MDEVKNKLKVLRELMTSHQLQALRLKGVDWFSWITGGGSSVVILTSEIGIAEVLVSQDQAWVLTNDIEAQRLRDEELSNDFEIITTSWTDPLAINNMVHILTEKGPVASDRPQMDEVELPESIVKSKCRLLPSEWDRYRILGVDAAKAMTEALSQVKPEWTEFQAAAVGAKALWDRGIHPTLVLVAGEERLPKYRHPTPSQSPVGQRMMMVFCGRRQGLYANLTRFIAFSHLTENEIKNFQRLKEIESVAFDQSRPGKSFGEIFQAISHCYHELGLSEQIEKQHFGGLTGYLSREAFAKPRDELRLEVGNALAWNPTLPASKIEDTILLTEQGLEILTRDESWPGHEFSGRWRPDVWVRES